MRHAGLAALIVLAGLSPFSSSQSSFSAITASSIDVSGDVKAASFGVTSSSGSLRGMQGSGDNVFLNFATLGAVQLRHSNSGTAHLTVNESGTTIGASGTAISKSIRGTATLDFASAAAGACSAVLTITVTGATTTGDVAGGVPNGSNTTGSDFFFWVSAADTVSVKHCCHVGTCDPTSGSFAARVFNP